MSFYVGKAIRLANWSGALASPVGGYRNSSGALYDPPAPTLKYQLPGAPKVSVTTPTLVKDAVGLYSLVVTPTQDGDASATFTSGDGAYADVATFKIEPTRL